MNNNQTIEAMLKKSNGIITSSQITEAGIPRRCLSEMVCLLVFSLCGGHEF